MSVLDLWHLTLAFLPASASPPPSFFGGGRCSLCVPCAAAATNTTQTGAVVAAAEFKPGAAVKAELKFALPTGATAITAYESCNLHGVWASAVFKC